MKKLFLIRTLFVLILISGQHFSFAQNSNKEIDELHKQIEKNMSSLDSSSKALDSAIKIRALRDDSIQRAQFAESNARGLNNLMNSINENRRKQERAAWLRIGLGIALLALGVFAMVRRKKRTTTT